MANRWKRVEKSALKKLLKKAKETSSEKVDKNRFEQSS